MSKKNFTEIAKLHQICNYLHKELLSTKHAVALVVGVLEEHGLLKEEEVEDEQDTNRNE